MRKASLISLGVLVAALAGCSTTPNFPLRKNPQTSFDSWISNAKCLGVYKTMYMESGILFFGEHPQYRGVSLYVLALDANGGGTIQGPQIDEWRSSYSANKVNEWKYQPPNTPLEDPPQIWETWKLNPKTLQYVDDLYQQKRKNQTKVAINNQNP